MAMSTFQKVTVATCLVLCVALLLPKMLLSRGRKDAAERPEGSGHFPPMMHRQEARGQRVAAPGGFSRAHSSEAVARAKGAGPGAGTASKSNLAGQIIPVYGFGILLYILYILFKITSKGNSKPSEGRFPSVRSENMKRKITDFELAQLQEKLRETELVMENIVSNAHHSPDRVKGVMADQEESLLQQLTEITRVMQEGQLVEGMTPEKKKTQESWEDYAEEQLWEHQHCCCPHSSPAGGQPQAAEAEAEQATHSPREHTAGGEEATAQEDQPLHLRDHQEQAGGGGGDGTELGVPDEELAGVLEELELTLKMTTILERQKMEDLGPPTQLQAQVQVQAQAQAQEAQEAQEAQAQSSCGAIRRRHRRRRPKKDLH